MEKILNQTNMSESLLYCMDGNNLTAEMSSSASTSPAKSRKRLLDEDSKEDSSNESLKRPLIDNTDL